MKSLAIALLLAPVALIPLVSTPASALSIVSYTSETLYKAALIPGSYSTDNFNDLTTGFKASPPGINRTAGSYSYNISAPVGLYVDSPDNPISFNKAIQATQQKTPLLISFTGVSPTAVGGRIFVSDATLLPLSSILNVKINDTFSQNYSTTDLASNYLGWTSADGTPITSIAFTPTALGSYSTVDNFTPGQAVPGPLPVLGALVAFRYSRKLRKRLAASTLVSDSTSA